MSFAIETQDLTKRFRREPSLFELVFKPFRKREDVTAVQDVTLAIAGGEVFGLLGPNGAGKTTLIKLLCNLIVPTSGSARVRGYDVAREGGRVRSRIGLVTNDERSFFWRLSGRRNLEFFASLHGMPRERIPGRVTELLRFFSLEDRVDAPFRTYSAGMKKKLALARGLLNDPDVLFLDEPTNSLDPVAAQQLRSLVKSEISSTMGKTVFWATHRLEEIPGLCDRVALMNKARIAFTGTVDEFRNMLAGEKTYCLRVAGLNGMIEGHLKELGFRRYAVSADDRRETVVEWRESDNVGLKDQLLRKVLANGGAIMELRLLEPSLEDVFMHFVRGRDGNGH